MSALSAPAHADLVPRCDGTTGSLGHDGWESFKRFNIEMHNKPVLFKYPMLYRPVALWQGL